MKDLIRITEHGVNAKDLYDFLEIKHRFRDWIGNSIRDYGFVEGKDFSYFFSESTGGRPSKEYAISVSMAKELSMVAKTEKGQQARKYFIKCEEIAKNKYIESKAIRLYGIEARKGMTDLIYQSGEDERMHGRGYSNYTRMVYQIVGIYAKFSKYKTEHKSSNGFRDSLSADELKRVEIAESMVKPLLEMEKQYGEIKGMLSPLFGKKEISK